VKTLRVLDSLIEVHNIVREFRYLPQGDDSPRTNTNQREDGRSVDRIAVVTVIAPVLRNSKQNPRLTLDRRDSNSPTSMLFM
jgi:hypothetical protein